MILNIKMNPTNMFMLTNCCQNRNMTFLWEVYQSRSSEGISDYLLNQGCDTKNSIYDHEVAGVKGYNGYRWLTINNMENEKCALKVQTAKEENVVLVMAREGRRVALVKSHLIMFLFISQKTKDFWHRQKMIRTFIRPLWWSKVVFVYTRQRTCFQLHPVSY